MRWLHCILLKVIAYQLYGCEVWHLNDSTMQKISVAWNNCFRRIFSCCWRESVKPLQYFCHTLPIPLLLHQRKLLFWKKLYCSESVVLQSLSRHMHQAFVAVGSLYNVLSPKLYNNSIRELIWNSFTMSVILWAESIISVLFYVFKFLYSCVVLYNYVWLPYGVIINK